MTPPALLILAALLSLITIFSDGGITVAKGAPDTTRLGGCCVAADPPGSGVPANPVLRSLDHAINAAEPGKSPTCKSGPDTDHILVISSAFCSASVSADDCKLCLYNAQFRLVKDECPEAQAGDLELVDCGLEYSTEYPFCAHEESACKFIPAGRR